MLKFLSFLTVIPMIVIGGLSCGNISNSDNCKKSL